jgi:hypothetical protein
VEVLPTALYVLDACSLLNLVASRRFREIARATAATFAVSEQAAREIHYVRRGGGGADANELEAIDLKALQDSAVLSVVSVDTPAELATFVGFALEMDDGEAASAALAVHRRGTLVTGDRKARRVLGRRSRNTPVLTTTQVIKSWAEETAPDPRDLAHLLRDVEGRARFRPGRHDPESA